MKGRRILVVGSGGREHALALALVRSPSVSQVFVCPGNGGMPAADAASSSSIQAVSGDPRALAQELGVDLVVVGPEGPLCDGLVDQLSADGTLAFGPTRAAARLESSKVFMKEFASRHEIRTARFVVVESARDVESAVRDFDAAPVVKADGLCAGKGVVVASTHAEAAGAARRMLSGELFGEAGRRVVIEERLPGAEASVHALCDGSRWVTLPAAQDHKRIGDGDTGPNTGGMGTYAPAPLITPELAARIEREILGPALFGMAEEGTPFRGVLFAGLMIGGDGEPRLLEFNVRFGDPETQVLMSAVEGDFGEALYGAARGELDTKSLRASGEHALCVVLAAAGYPGAPRTGDPITGSDEASAFEGVTVYHAGTKRVGQRLLTSGGRVLGVTGRGSSLKQAHERAYRAAECIAFEGKQQRSDIGHRALFR